MKSSTTALCQLFDSFGVFTPAEIEQILQYFEHKSYAKGKMILKKTSMLLTKELEN